MQTNIQKNLENKKTYFVLSSTEGCATNLQETSAYRADYEAKGFVAAPRAELADYILVNTCAYSQEMEDRATHMISSLQKKYPKAEVIVAGCLPKINPRKMKTEFSSLNIRSISDVSEEIQSQQFDREDFELLSGKHRLVLFMRPLYFWIENKVGRFFHPLHNLLKTVVVNEEFQLVTVSTGCLGKCTFCAIKRAKGSLRSRPLPTILSEIQMGLSRNKKLFWLLGDDIGCWGRDTGLGITDLLLQVMATPGSFELVLNYFDPHYFVYETEKLMSLLSNRKIVGLNIPIQSGSQKILNQMQRHYDLENVFLRLKQIKLQNPEVAIKTNIIVGFPGESWSDFLASVKSIWNFDAILALKFTARPNTPAASYESQISETVKMTRMLIINSAIFIRHSCLVLSAIFSKTQRAIL